MFGFIHLGAGPEVLFRDLLIVLPIFIISITLHEFAHAATAQQLGDSTAADAGRVTINPFAHLDPLGTLMILFGPIGWAKPVPIDPRYLGRWGGLLVAAAGPIANLILAAIAMAVLKHQDGFLAITGASDAVLFPFKIMLALNLALAVFNMLPIPPLDGSQIVYGLLPARLRPAYHQLLPYGIVVLVALVVFPLGGQMLDQVLDVAQTGLFYLIP